VHRKAHEAYRETLVESRTGANIPEEELIALDELISPLVRQGQSIHHVAVHNADLLNVCEKTIYRYVDAGLLQARNLDMPRVCRLKPRKTHPVQHKIDSACRTGRTYTDFTHFLGQTNCSYVEMDTVIGRVGGKALLTMLFHSCDFMMAFIRERNTSQSVIDIFNELQDRLGLQGFQSLFPAILTDNGSEFSNPVLLEAQQRTRIFYCDPHAAYQKPHVELSHEFIRKILPKGSSFDSLVQADINRMMSHINSYSREKLNDKAPIDLFSFFYGDDILQKLEMSRIPANDILLNPKMLK